MTDYFKPQFKPQTLEDEPLGNIFDLLTPEEKTQYAKSFKPTTMDTVGLGIGGLADAFTGAYGKRPTNYMEQAQARNKDRINQDMQFVGNELTRKYAERQAKAAAEKAGKEQGALIDTLNQDLPEGYLQPGVTGAAGQHIWDKLLDWKNKKELERLKPRAEGIDRDEKLFNEIYPLITGEKGSATTPLGRAHSKEVLAKDAKAVINSAKNGYFVATPQVEEEIAAQLGVLITNNSRVASEIIKGFQTKTGKKDVASMMQYIKAEPQDAISKEILDQLGKQVSRQHQFWSNERRKIGRAAKNQLEGSFQKKPELRNRWEMGMRETFPEDYQFPKTLSNDSGDVVDAQNEDEEKEMNAEGFY